MDVRLRQALGEAAELPENAYPGEYLVGPGRRSGWRADPQGMRALAARPEAERIERLGRLRGRRDMVEGQRRVLEAYGTRFDRWAHEQRDVRDAGLPERGDRGARPRPATPTSRTGRSGSARPRFGDDKDRVLRKSDGELTYFAVDIGFHHFGKFGGADHVINFLGPDHHGYVAAHAGGDAGARPPARGASTCSSSSS